MKRSQHIQMLRGLAALLVFVLHAMLIEQKYGRGVTLIGSAGWVGSVAVDLFFALSGFIMVSITTGRFQNRPYAVRFWLERFFRVYPAYWAVSLPLLCLHLVKPGMINTSQGGQVDVLASLLLWPQHILPLLSVGWTLVHEMYFYLVFALAVAFLPERWRLLMLLAWAALVAAVGGPLNLKAQSAWVALVLDPLTLDFIAGGLTAMALRHVPAPKPWLGRGLIVLSVCLFAVLLSSAPLPMDQLFLDRWWRVAVCALPSSLLIAGAVLSEGPPSPSSDNLSAWQQGLVWLGDRSYSFYLVHLLILSMAGKLWLSLGQGTLLHASLVYTLTLLICMWVAHLNHQWVEMPSLALGRRCAAAVERHLLSRSGLTRGV